MPRLCIVTMVPESGNLVGLIPARGGSKAIARKNLAQAGGRPLIAWTIEAALASRLLRRVIVSTDDEEIARVALRCGAEVPFMRPMELAGDVATAHDVAVHALEWLASERDLPEHLVYLQPTSPLRTAEDIDGAVQLALQNPRDSVVSVCRPTHHPDWIKRERDGLLIDYSEDSSSSARRQDLTGAFALNGAIYVAPARRLLSDQGFLDGCVRPYEMPVERSIDVDEPWDLYLVNLVLRDRGRSSRREVEP